MKSLEEIKENRNLLIGRTGVDGGSGVVYFSTWKGSVIWSFGCGWEHVSVSPEKKRITPSWDDMCKLKDMFFHDDETVIEYHPAKSEYVNMVGNCLHLWKPLEQELPIPPAIMVGIRNNQSLESAINEIHNLYHSK